MKGNIRSGAVTSERMWDDMQGSASTLGAGSAQCGPLMFVEQENEIGGCRAEMTAAQFQRLSAASVGKHSEVPDLYETGRQHVEKEATNELSRIEPHDAASVVVPGVPPAEAYLTVLEAEKSPVGDGDAMGVAGQILQHMLGSTKGRLQVDDPLSTPQASQAESERRAV
jgi:hypothetical protein